MRTSLLAVVITFSMVAIAFTPVLSPAAAHDQDGQISSYPSLWADVTYTKPGDFNELVSWYQALEQAYPNYLRVWKVNEDYGHGQIQNGSGGADYDYWMVRLTNESTGLLKPEVFFAGTPHGDETPGPVGQYWFTDWILRHALTDEYNTTEDDWLNWLLDNREIYMSVCHNPDGFSRVRRLDANNYDLNRQADYDHVPNSGMFNTGPEPFYTPNGRTLRDFINDHQFRLGADHHSGVRMILYPWSSTHPSVSATSQKSGKTYDYAPPDFDYFDVSSLRLGSFIGSTHGTLDKDNIGTIPDTVGYEAPGGIAPWAYGADVINNSVEDPYVQDEIYGNYRGTGILWLSPEWSSPKNPAENTFGSDLTPGYGPEVRRFLLHQTDLAQPYIWITKDSIANNSVVNVGEDMQFLWKVNGCLVVDDTFIQYGSDPDPIANFEATTPHRDMFKGQYFGGSGWENAAGGSHVGYVHSQVVKAPDEPGDYYFVMRAMVDQVFANVTDNATYGPDPYLRLVKERTNASYVETYTGADGVETITGQLWWYSDIVHITVVKEPEIMNVTPKDGSTWVPTDTNISVEFDIEMETADTEAAFIIEPPAAGTFSWDANSTNLTFDPDGELQGETLYNITINSSARSKMDTLLGADHKFHFTTAFSPDITLPEVTNTSPVHGAENVSIKTDVRVQFSEDMDMNATGSAFAIMPVVSGAITWENGSSTLVFTPDGLLDGPIDHIVSISTTAMDLGRNHLAKLFTFTFRTEVPDKVLPEVISTDPADGETMVPLSSNITIEFSEPMFAYYTEPAFSIFPDIDGDLTWNHNNTILTFDPAEDLTPEMDYTVNVSRNATDLYFNRLREAHSFTFTAEDITPPWIISTSPVDGATDIWVETDITVNFSEEMSLVSLQTAFSIEPAIDINVFVTGPGAAFSSDGRLEYETTYTVNITTEATDLNGLHLKEGRTFSFTTAKEPDLITPKVIFTDPADKATNVSVFGGMIVRFSEPIFVPPGINPVTLSPQPGQPYDTDVDGDTITLVPRTPSVPWLSDHTAYTMKISSAVEDLSLNPMGFDKMVAFTTGYAGPPSVISFEPGDETTGVPTDTTLTIEFSRPMDWDSVELAVKISPEVKGHFEVTDNTVVITPFKRLDGNTVYKVTVTTAARDTVGNRLGQTFTSSFKTERTGTTGPTDTGLGDTFTLLLLVAVIVAVVIVLVAVMAMRRKGKVQQAQGEGPPEVPPEGTMTQPEPVYGPPPQEQYYSEETQAEPETEPEPEQEPEAEPEPEQEPEAEPEPEPEPEPKADEKDPASELDDLMKELDKM